MGTSTISNSSLDSGSTASATSTSAPVSATTSPAPRGAFAATGLTPPALPVALRVDFTLNTTDGLRQISFGLEKDSDGVTTDWTITFMLFERTDPGADFGSAVVSLNVFVASHLNDSADAAAHLGMTPAQTAHATGPAADAAKAVSTGELSFPVGNRIIQGTLSAQ